MSISYFLRKRQITSNLLLAIIALTAISALLIPTYAVPTIRSADIFDGEVKTADLANGAVTNPKLANDAVTSGKIKNGEVKAEDIAPGVIPSGGIQLNVHIVEGPLNTLEALQTGDSVADCPEGEILTGGGWSGQAGAKVRTNAPLDENTWRVLADNEVAGKQTLQAYAFCIDPTIP
jgi:hypothetical protein